jgi:hypothetical protein
LLLELLGTLSFLKACKPTVTTYTAEKIAKSIRMCRTQNKSLLSYLAAADIVRRITPIGE